MGFIKFKAFSIIIVVFVISIVVVVVVTVIVFVAVIVAVVVVVVVVVVSVVIVVVVIFVVVIFVAVVVGVDIIRVGFSVPRSEKNRHLQNRKKNLRANLRENQKTFAPGDLDSRLQVVTTKSKSCTTSALWFRTALCWDI